MTQPKISLISGNPQNTISSKFNSAKNAYLAKLSALHPSQTIDQLKDMIRKEVQNGKQIVAETNSRDEYIIQTKAIIDEVEERTGSAKRDKMELFRDLATFEDNFAKRNKKEMFGRIRDLKVRICDKNVEFQALTTCEGIRGWLDDVKI